MSRKAACALAALLATATPARATDVQASQATSSSAAAATLAPFSASGDAVPPPPWQVVTLPKLPRHTRYRVQEHDGARVLRMETDGGYANLLHPIARTLADRPQLAWRWQVGQFPGGSDLTRKAGDDTAARVCVLFDVPLARLSLAEQLKVRLGRALFDPALPAAAVCYVWDVQLPAGTWLPNAYTARVQMLVLRSAASGDGSNAWRSESRDLAADFARAFPQEARDGWRPALAAVGVAADGDNTGSRALAFIGDLALQPSAAGVPR